MKVCQLFVLAFIALAPGGAEPTQANESSAESKSVAKFLAPNINANAVFLADLDASELMGKVRDVRGRDTAAIQARVDQAKYQTYRMFLRLRRYLAFFPQQTGDLHGFRFMTGDNVKRAISLGVKLNFVATMASALFDTARVAANHMDVFRDLASTFDLRSDGLQRLNQQNPPQESMSARKGFYVNRQGFPDVSLSNVYEVLLAFLSHRTAMGQWNENVIDETLVSTLRTGRFRTSREIENAVNHIGTAGAGMALSATAMILIAIPEPVTTAIGAAMLIASKVMSFSTWGLDAIFGNVVKYSVQAHLSTLLTSFWVLENKAATVEPTKIGQQIVPNVTGIVYGQRCDITQNECPQDMPVCQREFIFSLTMNEGWLANEYGPHRGEAAVYGNEFDPLGYCASSMEELSGVRLGSIGDMCELHRDCATGYCHFSLLSISTRDMWRETMARLATNAGLAYSRLPEPYQVALTERGTCLPAIRLGGSCKKYPGLRYQQISDWHTFATCGHSKMPRPPAHTFELPPRTAPEQTAQRDRVTFGRPLLFRTASRDLPDLYFWANRGRVYDDVALRAVFDSAPAELSERLGIDPLALSTNPFSIASIGAFIEMECTSQSQRQICNGFQFRRQATRVVTMGAFVTVVLQVPTEPQMDALNAWADLNAASQNQQRQRAAGVPTNRFLTNGRLGVSLSNVDPDARMFDRLDLRHVWRIRPSVDPYTEVEGVELRDFQTFALESAFSPGEFLCSQGNSLAVVRAGRCSENHLYFRTRPLTPSMPPESFTYVPPHRA